MTPPKKNVSRVAGREILFGDAEREEMLFKQLAFMKEFKMRMTGWYNRKHGRVGTLWEGVFKCVLVEGTQALEMVSAYIDLNPLRAVFGPEATRVTGTKRPSWAKTVAKYRMLLYGLGEESAGGVTVDGVAKRNGGFTAAEIREVLASRGKLSLAQALRCRVRYFTVGVVLGSGGFVDRFFEKKREWFGPRRATGARRLRGAEWGELRTLRDLRVDSMG